MAAKSTPIKYFIYNATDPYDFVENLTEQQAIAKVQELLKDHDVSEIVVFAGNIIEVTTSVAFKK